jgi:CRP-like cAMP-binding protein
MKMANYEVDGKVVVAGEACQAMQIIYEGEVEYFTLLTEGPQCKAFADKFKSEIEHRKTYIKHKGFKNYTIEFAFERLGKGSILNSYSFINNQSINETARCTKPTMIFYLSSSIMQQICIEFPKLG